jgi:hypothetical protein
VVRGRVSVVSAADGVEVVLDFLLGPPVVIGKEDVLGQVRELLLSTRIHIPSIRHTDADGDVRGIG